MDITKVRDPQRPVYPPLRKEDLYSERGGEDDVTWINSKSKLSRVAQNGLGWAGAGAGASGFLPPTNRATKNRSMRED